MLGQAEIPARRQVLAKANLEQPQDPEEAHRRRRHHVPVHQRAGDSFGGPALQARQDTRRLAEREKGEQAARGVLGEREDRGVERRRQGKIGEHRKQIVGRVREEWHNHFGHQERPKMTVQQEGGGDGGPAFGGIRHPGVSGADSFPEDNGNHQQTKDGHPARAPALEPIDRHHVALDRNDRDGQHQGEAGKQQADARTPRGEAEPTVHEKWGRRQNPGAQQHQQVVSRVR